MGRMAGAPTVDDALRGEVARFVRESPQDRFPGSDERYFEEPLLGVAAAADPIFDDLKGIIGTFHRTPREILAGAASVVCWVLPISRATRESNRREREIPSLAWARTRRFGEELNNALRRHLVAWLGERGGAAVAPLLAPDWQRFNDTPVGIASSWSERHAAYAAGLGTFSLNDGLITERGIAHRLGSVVTDLPLTPTSGERPGVRDHCLFYGGTCTSCIARCPVGAISPAGHDKALCAAYVEGAAAAALAGPLGASVPSCGLCQTRVPCEHRIPRRPGRRASRAPRARTPPAGSSPARTPPDAGSRGRATH
jgi:epoxyqueuosine reductase